VDSETSDTDAVTGGPAAALGSAQGVSDPILFALPCGLTRVCRRSETAEPVRNFVPTLVGREFATWDSFFGFFEQYEKTNLVCYRTRDSLSVAAYNKLQVSRKHPERQVPRTFEYAFRKYKCTLGCPQKSRSTGKRVKKTSRFRGCAAFFRAAVVQVGSEKHPRWSIRVSTEVHM
jgi:hypothetical protein